MRYELSRFRAGLEEILESQGLAAKIAQNLEDRPLHLEHGCPPLVPAELVSSAGYPKGSPGFVTAAVIFGISTSPVFFDVVQICVGHLS
jgi:hypothetical protein